MKKPTNRAAGPAPAAATPASRSPEVAGVEAFSGGAGDHAAAEAPAQVLDPASEAPAGDDLPVPAPAEAPPPEDVLGAVEEGAPWHLDAAPGLQLQPFTPDDDDLDDDAFEGPFISVRSVAQGGRRRAGLAFGPAPTFIPLSLLTQEQIDALHADEHLAVQIVED